MAKKRRNGGSAYSEEEEEVIMGFSSVYLWVDPTLTAPVFVSVLVSLISICYYSVLSVIAYSALFILGTATGIKLYVYVMNNLLKKEAADPLARFDELDLTLSEEKVQEWSQSASSKLNCTITELRRLFLVENWVDSAKFGLTLWFLTYIGSWFNAMTLIILSWVALFTVPKIYTNNRQTFDPVLEKFQEQFDAIKTKVSAVIPSGGGAAKSQEEVKKEE